MRNVLILLILFVFCFSDAKAGLKEPGKINSLQCALNALDGYKEALEYLKKNPKKNSVVYLACLDGGWSWYWSGSNKISKAHKTAFKNCSKNSKKNGNGECFLFSENDKIVWELSEEKKVSLNQIIIKLNKHDENKYTGWPHPYQFVNINDPRFVKYTDQKKKLIYVNQNDDIEGRNLYDQEDKSDDFQVHAIYVLASDSKDKKYDVNGVIERIVLKGNKHLKNKTKEKSFRLDFTKEGKLDISFLRLPITKKELNNHQDGTTIIAAEAVRNGFYHPKKLYSIFYQDKYKREWGQVGSGTLETPNGDVEIVSGVVYLGGEGRRDAYIPHLHELFHALGFVQLCAPAAVIEKNSRWGKNDHLTFAGDIMSNNDSGNGNIDSKRKHYYGHSMKNCPMDLRKSVFLEPTEKDPQHVPRTENCYKTQWVEVYNHQRSVDCLNRLNF
jgi:hypothetical protein